MVPLERADRVTLSCVKISLIHLCKVYFLRVNKTLYMTIGPNRGGIRRVTILKKFYFPNLLIYSNREKNSASNEPNINGSHT